MYSLLFNTYFINDFQIGIDATVKYTTKSVASIAAGLVAINLQCGLTNAIIRIDKIAYELPLIIILNLVLFSNFSFESRNFPSKKNNSKIKTPSITSYNKLTQLNCDAMLTPQSLGMFLKNELLMFDIMLGLVV
ncbi:hypothetical protein [Metamycoplasma equirhinis]|uniref:hypothetical protein n=1 Tax=Metamycoplasma equirhinis TaxID=92402 RepID=UPI003593AA99